MNLIEAVKSGKLFRRKWRDKWYKKLQHDDELGEGLTFHINEMVSDEVTVEDILADDYEIVEE